MNAWIYFGFYFMEENFIGEMFHHKKQADELAIE